MMKKYRATKMSKGGKTPVKPQAKPGFMDMPKSQPARKYSDLPPSTQGESLGRMVKKGDYAGAAKLAGESIAEAPKELLGALKRAAKFQEGGKMKKTVTPMKSDTKRYKDSQGRTYVINSQGQKIFDGVPIKKPASTGAAAGASAGASAGSAKATTPKTNPRLFMTEGERFGDMIKKGEYKDAATMMAEGLANAPGELVRAFRRSVR